MSGTQAANGGIGTKTPITVGLAIILAANLTGGTAAYFDLAYRIQAVEASLELTAGDRYRRADAESFALRLAIQNPGMKIPDPANPSQSIVVTRATVGSFGE